MMKATVIPTRMFRAIRRARKPCYCVARGLASVTGSAQIEALVTELEQVDTAALCDADKTLLAQLGTYAGIRLLKSNVRPINISDATSNHVMVGRARTVQCSERNDFLAVLHGLMLSEKGDVLMVDTCNSDRAVAGELFSLEAIQRGVKGIVIDGPMRDTVHVRDLPASMVRCYSTAVTPYSGTTQSPGILDVPITCGGVTVNPGDIVIGDNDGLIVADKDTLETLLPQAKMILDAEEKLKDGILRGKSLACLTSYEEHIEARLAGQTSSLGFKV
ncbi:Putative 4-hydroxy-4-methyl-2-oxoglutarate aldolase [Seminavis robusta]|uniref:4-hydroxy-4-methyl-2-oxoglutarate aldolase n=1 Tax=Seminavis robusta TaxID=568900 RepID=A0A9N8EFE5_9STRA|nr:Putative 4-hydroxy-4-methyl-2-oxoglutarate aldolase [Seminavis robusta]|eukprot:Sro1014_g231400.1 Putative 4-hydroxy-4-methyl-2-oxoglutarate aldolase (275) ;mRNA; f:11023-11847